MVRNGLLLFLIFLVFALCGCANLSGASAGKILPPPASGSPFAGKWTVMKSLSGAKVEEPEQQWEGSTVQFAEGIVVFGGQLWDNLSYKVKRVDAAVYLSAKDILSSEFSLSDSQKVDVTTIYAAGSYLGEFVKINDNSMIFFVQNNDLLLEKVSNQADNALRETYTEAQLLHRDNIENTSGVLLGLRAPTASDSRYTYRTLWISADRKQLCTVFTAEQLFFPRLSGFWVCSVSDVTTNGSPGTLLTAHSAFAREEAVQAEEAPVVSEPAIQIINYIGNDYISVESMADGVRTLQVLPVDTLSSPTRMKALDLLGESGLIVYENARKEAEKSLSEKGATILNRDALGENFGLVREKGHWKLVGRIPYLEKGVAAYMDFDLNIIPPYNLIFYDTLALNWRRIKDRVPDALDAFTSPDQNIALVKTKNKLTVYAVGPEKLSENALGEVELREGETIIMAEWATANYVEPWEKAFLAYGAKEERK